MSLSSHIQELKKKHQALSESVETIQRSPAADHLEITALKRQKLRLKEQIERHEARLNKALIGRGIVDLPPSDSDMGMCMGRVPNEAQIRRIAAE